MSARFTCLKELQRDLFDQQTKLMQSRKQEKLDMDKLDPQTRKAIANNISWWILQAQIDLLSQLIDGSPGSRWEPKIERHS